MKKGLLIVGALAIAIATVPLFAAFEAHVINVTAHIENALYVHPDEIAFGTVFPQEYVERDFTVELSKSFLGEERVDDVSYVINQKPKPIWPQTLDCEESAGVVFGDIDEARAYCHDNPEDLDCCYLSLCPYLSKEDGDPDDANDRGVPSYYQGDGCITPSPDYASGYLSKGVQDIVDLWTVDLKVPPVDGFVGQDWPDGCPVVDENDMDYGCDLWIEVTGISEAD